MQANGTDAWTRMSSLYAPLVYYWCLREGLQSTDAEDVVQEVFCTVAARVDSFHRDRNQGSFRGWLRTITRHKLGDFLRARYRRPETHGAETQDAEMQRKGTAKDGEAEQPENTSEETRLLYARVLEFVRTEFEEQTWRACLRVVVDGAAPKDVADELGMSVNSVYLAKSRILRRVRDELGDIFGH